MTVIPGNPYSQPAVPHTSARTQRPPLVRATAESANMPTPWLSGVASGIAVHLGVSVVAIRMAFIASTFFMFIAGLIAYLLLVALLPVDSPETNPSARGARKLAPLAVNRRAATSRNQMLMAGSALIALAILLLLASMNDGPSVRTIMSLALVISGLAVAWTQTSQAEQIRSLKLWLFLSSGLMLIVFGVTLYLTGRAATGELIRGAFFGGGMILIIFITLAPLWVRMSRQLLNEKAQHVRERERADIAAHLHDSVLQTLTLIRAGAENPAKVRALALTQERELREWLYGASPAQGQSTAQLLREAAVDIEATYGVAIDVVTVGDTFPAENESALVNAAAEAMKNAVRHGAAPVSAFLEIRAGQADLYVKDRGSGFDLNAIASDRHGVRGSIIGRVERIGGAVSIRRLNPGTEVHVSVACTPTAFGTDFSGGVGLH